MPKITLHPRRAAREAELMFHRLAYEGGPAFLDRYLSQHPKEEGADWARRRERAVYPNLTRHQVSVYAAQLYRSAVQRTVAEAATDAARAKAVLTALWDDADLNGNAASVVMRDVAERVQVYGEMAVVVDRTVAPEGEGAPLTRAQEVELGLRPYLRPYAPLDILDWAQDARGQLQWILLRHRAADDRQPLQEIATEPVEYVVWTRQEVMRYAYIAPDGDKKEDTDNLRLTSSTVHGLGVVPVEFVFWGSRDGTALEGQSAISDLAPMNRRLTNLISLIDEQIFAQTFNLLVVGPSTYDKLASLNFSVHGVMLQGEDDPAPFYLGPSGEQIASISDEVSATVRWMRMLSGGPGRGVDDGMVPPSGVSMAYQSSDKFALFKEFAGRMEDFERRLCALALKWEGVEGVEATITYSQDFDPVLVARTLEDSLTFDALGIGGLAKLESEQQAIRRHLAGTLSPEDLNKVLQDHRERFTATNATTSTSSAGAQTAPVGEGVAALDTQAEQVASAGTAPAGLQF